MFLLMLEEPVSLEIDDVVKTVIGVFDEKHIKGALDNLYKDRGFVANYPSKKYDRNINGKWYRLNGTADVIDLKINDYRSYGHS